MPSALLRPHVVSASNTTVKGTIPWIDWCWQCQTGTLRPFVASLGITYRSSRSGGERPAALRWARQRNGRVPNFMGVGTGTASSTDWLRAVIPVMERHGTAARLWYQMSCPLTSSVHHR